MWVKTYGVTESEKEEKKPLSHKMENKNNETTELWKGKKPVVITEKIIEASVTKGKNFLSTLENSKIDLELHSEGRRAFVPLHTGVWGMLAPESESP